MNIFVLRRCPYAAARDHCDKHVVKMCLEYAQLLCTVSAIRGKPARYKPTHKQHPCTRWLLEADANVIWLGSLLEGLGNEYKRRYGRVHASVDVGMEAHDLIRETNMAGRKLTPFAQAMPEEYKHPNAVTAYRSYYRGAKAAMATWRNGAPGWWN